MRIVFFGTGEFGIPTLRKLFDNEHELVAVVTQPDRKKGRGWNVHPTPIKAVIEQVSPGISVLQPEDISDREFIDFLKKKMPDLFIVVDYGKKLKKDLLNVPRGGCVNLHPSLLPKYRGPAPVNWAILNGECQTGNTVIRMQEEIDAGEIVAQEKIDIKTNENAVELLERLSQKGAELVMSVLEKIASNKAEFKEQNKDEASYAPKLKKEQGKIDWASPAEEISRKIRALQPWPAAYTSLDGKMLKIFKAHLVDAGVKDDVYGRILYPGKFIVNTPKDALQIDMLQLEGRKVMTRDEFLKGYKLKEGTVLG